MDHFANRAHHRAFLFVAETEVGGERAARIRAFRLTANMDLREETSQHVVGDRW